MISSKSHHLWKKRQGWDFVPISWMTKLMSTQRVKAWPATQQVKCSKAHAWGQKSGCVH